MAGELITRDGQAEIRGLLIGAGTPYAVEGWSGLGLPDVRASDEDLEGADGAASGIETYAPRSISATIGISAWDRVELGARRDALAAAFRRARGTRDVVPFVIRLAGQPRRFHVRPRHLELPWAGMASAGMMLSGAFEVRALDPYAYAVEETVATLTIGDGASSTSAVVTNAGNGRTYPIVKITGPATDPVVANLETGAALRTDVALGTTDVLEVDVAAGTMLLNGVRTWAGRSDYQILELEGGPQELAFTRTGGGIPSTAEIRYRSAWESL